MVIAATEASTTRTLQSMCPLHWSETDTYAINAGITLETNTYNDHA